MRMERIFPAIMILVVLALWLGVVVWIIKRFRNTWEMLRKGQLSGSLGQTGPGPPSPPTPDQPRTNAMGIVTETLEESLARHRKQVEKELAELMKQQSRPK